MKPLLFTILGSVSGWFLFAFFTKNYETNTLFTLIGGIIIGKSINQKRDN